MNFEEKYKGKPLKYQVTAMHKLKHELEDIKATKAAMEKEHDYLRLNAIPTTMEEQDIGTIKYTGIGQVILTGDVRASILAANKPKAFDWFKKNGHEGIIKEDVNSSTLKALVKKMIKTGENFPEDLISAKPFTRASIKESD